MGILDSWQLEFEDRKVKVLKRSVIKRGWHMLLMRKSQLRQHRQQRRELWQALENLTDPSFLARLESDGDDNED